MLPMDGDIVVDMVDHLDKKVVTLPSYNARPRKLPVYCHNALVVAQSCYILQYNLHNNSKLLTERKSSTKKSIKFMR